MKHSAGFEPGGERLARILEIATEQRQLLGRGDLKAVQALQERRQQLLAGIQSLDNSDPSAKGTLSAILDLDREMGCILSSELVDIQDKIQKISTLRKLLRSHPRGRRRPTRHLSRHI